MKVHFLSAHVPLTKSFSVGADGTIEKSPYPLVRDFTSHDVEVSSLAEFLAAINTHADQGHCLLKGALNRALNDQSRAGSTNPADTTEWVCFDIDNLAAIDSVDRFVNEVLPPEFRAASYILQYSCSAGVSNDTGLRAHVFYLLAKSTSADLLKLFVTALNLSNPLLCSQMTLTAAGTSLKYPLDRSVNQSDKLIYIAPPALQLGMVDSLHGKRIQLVSRTHERVAIDWSKVSNPAQVEQQITEKVDSLRVASGLKIKKSKHRALPTGETLLSNPDVAVVTGERHGRGYVYLNLNGGDSWGYFYKEENPQYLYNFKGEPVVELADIAPTYWAQLQASKQTVSADTRIKPFVFRRHETDTMHAGVWDGVDKRFIVPPSQIKRESLDDFFALYDASVPDPVETWRYEFDPTNQNVFDPANRFCNQWEATPIMCAAKPSGCVPPVIDRVLRSIVADDMQCYHHFLNWLACIYQSRRKMSTAWVFHGIEGTGKGILFKDILVPLFGRRHCLSKLISALDDQFNADLEQCLFMFIDEARVEDSASARRTINRIKNMITEELQGIRAMRSGAVQVRNFTNMIFGSNEYDSLAISPTDRRFNVAPRQEVKLEMTDDELDRLRQVEIYQFAGFLGAYPADMQRARTALNNEAKTALRTASQDSFEQLCQAVQDGDLEYFMQYAESGIQNAHNIVAWTSYQAAMHAWLETVNTDSVITRDELMNVYVYLMAPKGLSPNKFTRALSHKNLVVKLTHCPTKKKSVRGLQVKWLATEEQLLQWRTAMNVPQEKQPSNTPANVLTWKPSNSASA